MKKTNQVVRIVMAAILFAITLGPIYLGSVFAAPGDKGTLGYDSINSRDEIRVNTDGHILPGADDHQDLGSTTLEFRNAYIDGTLFVDTISGAGAVTTAVLGDGSVTTPKLGDRAVTTSKLGDGAVTPSKILDASVTTPKIANGSVTTSKIFIDAPTSRISCVTSARILGHCSAFPAGFPAGDIGCTCT